MELKNANPNGCNVVRNNKQSASNGFIFFQKILKIEYDKGLQSYEKCDFSDLPDWEKK